MAGCREWAGTGWSWGSVLGGAVVVLALAFHSAEQGLQLLSLRVGPSRSAARFPFTGRPRYCDCSYHNCHTRLERGIVFGCVPLVHSGSIYFPSASGVKAAFRSVARVPRLRRLDIVPV